MRKVGNFLYWLAFAVGAAFLVGSTFPEAPTGASSGLYALIAFGAAFLLSTFEKGNKTALQKIFLAAFGGFATGAIAFSLGWIGWVGAGLSMFLVSTMKLDGGDRDSA